MICEEYLQLMSQGQISENIQKNSSVSTIGWYFHAGVSFLSGLFSRKIQSNIFAGEKDRMYANMTRQQELEELRADSQKKTQEELLNKGLDFNRRLMQSRYEEQSRLLQVTKMLEDNKRYLLLDKQVPYNVYDGLKNHSPEVDLLNVVILRTPLYHIANASEKNRRLYEALEDMLENTMEETIGGIYVRKGASVDVVQNVGNSHIMNIYYFLQALPTLVVVPVNINGKMKVSLAYWDVMVAHPFIKPIFEMAIDVDRLKDDEEYSRQWEQDYCNALVLLVATMHDVHYFGRNQQAPFIWKLLEGRGFNQTLKRLPGLRNYIKTEYHNIEHYVVEPVYDGMFDKQAKSFIECSVDKALSLI